MAGRLDIVSEIPTLLLAGLIGSWADRIGRRNLFALGFALLASAFLLFPLTRPDWSLYAAALLAAGGAACIGTMIATVIADYPTERSRGKLVGICFFLNGVGIATMVGLPQRVPAAFQAAGLPPAEAVHATYWVAAALCLVPLLVTRFGLSPTLPARAAGLDSEPPRSLAQRLLLGLKAGRDPRVRLAFASALVSRAALSIVSGFFFLWMVEAGRAQGMTATEAYQRSGGVLVTVQIVATLWSVIVMSFIDRLDRVVALAGGAALTCIGYLTFGSVSNPFQPAMYGAAVLMGIGEMSGILTSQALIGKVAPTAIRGAVVGVFTICGGLGILLAAWIGGELFDRWRPSAPYLLMGCAAGLLCLYAVWVHFRYRAKTA
ncbi:MAG: MFS transporter [Steroidobacteraceae bacterium]|nr:MFS transporter [Steroidobacteraceae bacterium]MDW8258948.1 MFS transporter [Gammaproteobacteria bacterium]